jgi:hypothetical protein
MHCNAFSSGLYCHLAIVNHSCRPNCVKFAPSVAATGRKPTSSSSSLSRNDCSEIRAITTIAAGEPITISYLTPCDQTRARRRHALRTQFRFDCTCERCGDEERGYSEPLQGKSAGTFGFGWQCEALLCAACAPAALASSAEVSTNPLHNNCRSVDDSGDDAVSRVFALPHISALNKIVLSRSGSPPPQHWHCPACARVVPASAMAAFECHVDSLECYLDALEDDIASDNFTAARALRVAMPALRMLRARLDGVVGASAGGGSASIGTATAVAAFASSYGTTAIASVSASTSAPAIQLHPHHVLNVRFHRLRFDAAAMALSAVRRQASVPAVGSTSNKSAHNGAGVEQQHCALLLESALASVRLRPLILDAATNVDNAIDGVDGGGHGLRHCDAAKAWQDVVFALGEWRKAAFMSTNSAIDATLVDQCAAFAQHRFEEISACYE